MALRSLIIHGNEFDQYYASYASSSFPKYEEFWAKYIGCDSSDGLRAKELKIPNIDPHKDNLRKVIGQWNYTVFINYIHLDELSKEIPDFKIESFTKLEKIHLLSSHLYYTSIDCLSKIKNKLRLPIKGKKIGIIGYNYYRNVLAHNVRPLVKVRGTEYYVIHPSDASKFKKTLPKNENESPIWSEGFGLNPSITFISLNDSIEFFKKSINEGFNLILESELMKFVEMVIPQLGDAPDPNGSLNRFGFPIVSGTDYSGNSILPKN